MFFRIIINFKIIYIDLEQRFDEKENLKIEIHLIFFIYKLNLKFISAFKRIDKQFHKFYWIFEKSEIIFSSHF
jgi:hypothetical protein